MISWLAILIVTVGMVSNIQACRACAHWIMDTVNRPANAEGWQANFGLCRYDLPDLPFWAAPVVGKQRLTMADAGDRCPTFSPRPPS